MKWLLVNSKTSLLQEYQLVEANKCLMVIKYNPVHRSARISCNGTHRLFFIESAGALTGKYIFRNEYDMEIGHMNYDRGFAREGHVTIEAKKYDYKSSASSSDELGIYDGDSGKPLLNCELAIGNDANSSISQQKSSVENNFLLLGLCWYQFLAVSKKNQVEFAA